MGRASGSEKWSQSWPALFLKASRGRLHRQSQLYVSLWEKDPSSYLTDYLKDYRFLMSLQSQLLLSSLLQHSMKFSLYIMVPFRVKIDEYNLWRDYCVTDKSLPRCVLALGYPSPLSRPNMFTFGSKKTRWRWTYCQTWGFKPVVQNNGLHHGGFTLVSVHLKQIKKILFFLIWLLKTT